MNSKEIQTQLKNIRVRSLDALEQERVWENVRLSISPSVATKPRRSRFSTLKKSIAITLVFGMTAGVTFAADSAKPGDALFTLDRALENLQLSIASESKKDELKVKFALERVSEVKDILKEVSVQPTDTSIKTAPEETAPERSEEEDEIIPSTPPEKEEQINEPEEAKITTNGPPEEVATQDTAEDVTENTTEETSTQDTTETAEEEVTEDSKEEATTTPDTTEKTEGKAASTSPDTISNDTNTEQPAEQKAQIIPADMSDGDKKRIELALGTALSFLGDVKGELADQGNEGAVEYIDLMLEQINEEIDTLPGNITFEVDLSTKKERVKFEIISTDDKPKVQIEVAEQEEDIPENQEVPVEQTTSSEETTLEIKDGGLVITPTKSVDGNDEGKTEGPDETPEPTEKDGGNTTKDEEQTEGTLPEDGVTEDEENEKDITDTEETVEDTEEVTGSEEENSTGTDSPTQTNAEESNEDDGTTTVKVIIKKLGEEFELSVIDKNEGLHEIIEEYTDEKGDV